MKKGKNLEEDYFYRQDQVSKHKISEEEKRKQKAQEKEKQKNLHYMKCPKCGDDLTTKRMSYIDIDQCTSCGVLVLEPQNVEKFIAEERSMLKTLIDFFK